MNACCSNCNIAKIALLNFDSLFLLFSKILCYMEQFYYQPCVGSVGQSSAIEVTYSERSFSALESSGQLTVTISLLEHIEDIFNLTVIPIAKYPLDAEGTYVR